MFSTRGEPIRIAILSAMIVLSSACNSASMVSSGHSSQKTSQQLRTLQQNQAVEGDSQRKKKVRTKQDDSDSNHDTKESKLGQNNDSDALGRTDRTRCLSKAVDLRVIFLIDSTGSMQSSVDLVKTNVRGFSDALEKITFNSDIVKVDKISIGAISYRDSEAEIKKIPLRSADELGRDLDTISAEGGDDAYEGGLLALLQGMQMLMADPVQEEHEVVPVIIAITDNFSHNGEGGAVPGSTPGTIQIKQRDCRVNWSPLLTSLADKNYDKMVLYDASPFASTHEGLQCLGYEAGDASPARQWKDIRSAWVTANLQRKASIGAGVGFPFTSKGLIETLPKDIESSFEKCEN